MSSWWEEERAWRGAYILPRTASKAGNRDHVVKSFQKGEHVQIDMLERLDLLQEELLLVLRTKVKYISLDWSGTTGIG